MYPTQKKGYKDEKWGTEDLFWIHLGSGPRIGSPKSLPMCGGKRNSRMSCSFSNWGCFWTRGDPAIPTIPQRRKISPRFVTITSGALDSAQGWEIMKPNPESALVVSRTRWERADWLHSNTYRNTEEGAWKPQMSPHTTQWAPSSTCEPQGHFHWELEMWRLPKGGPEIPLYPGLRQRQMVKKSLNDVRKCRR